MSFMIAIVRNRRAGIYCAHHLGDDPSRSSTGCRFYVYVGRACEAWLDYHDLDAALEENPGEPVFDRAITEDVSWDADSKCEAAEVPR
jgi:hypothetical protein